MVAESGIWLIDSVNFLGEDNMRDTNMKVIITTVLCLFLATACSKKIMPPEIETSGSASEETEFTASAPPSPSSTDGSGGPVDSGYFSEEPILEDGSATTSSSEASRPGGAGIAGSAVNEDHGSSGQQNIGNGSAGSFESNPFVSNGSDSMDNGIQESRLQSYEKSAELKDIHFKFDQYDLDSNSKAILKKNAAFIKSKPGMHVEIQGHCDERGTNNYNIALGERRANSTKQYLVSQGVDSSNVHVISYGEEKPFCFTSGESCWKQNRRAHFMVSK